MPCFHPITAYRNDGGDIVFFDRSGGREIKLPCGQCIGCRLERSRQWAVRCMHEASMYDNNSFVTLTYDDDHVPHDFSLHYRDFQLFMKKLRKSVGFVRFFMCGEYGEQTSRPHFHACLFGYRPGDLYYWRKLPSGFDSYRSPSLEAIWTDGACEVGDVTYESAAYVGRYCLKKVTGSAAKEHYSAVDGSTGEIYERRPEFARMSLKPGIGRTWFDRYRDEVFPRDRVVVRGVECKPPRYYKKVYDSISGVESDDVDYRRYLKGLKFSGDNTEDRLRVKEEILRARVMQLKRGN